MSRPPLGSDWLHAGALVDGATGVAVSRSNLTPSRTGVGVYALTLDQPIGPSEGAAIVTIAGAAAGADITSEVDHTSDAVKTVSLTAGGAPVDADFSVAIFRLQVDRQLDVAPENPAISEPRTMFVYRPADPAGQHENVYIDWPTMLAALGNVEGFKAIYVDDRYAPATIPAGTWDVTDTRIFGANSLLTSLTALNGAVLQSTRLLPAYELMALTIVNTGASPLITLTPGQTIVSIAVAWVGVGAPVVSSPGTNTTVIPRGFSSLVNAGSPAVEGTAGVTTIVGGEGTRIGADSLSGAGAITVTVLANSSTVDAQTLIGGTYIVNSVSPTFGVAMADRWQVPAIGTLVGSPGALHRVDTTAGPVAVALPASRPGTVGNPIVIKKTVAEAVNAVSFTPDGGDTILGPSSSTSAFGSVMVADNGDGTWSTVAVI